MIDQKLIEDDDDQTHGYDVVDYPLIIEASDMEKIFNISAMAANRVLDQDIIEEMPEEVFGEIVSTLTTAFGRYETSYTHEMHDGLLIRHLSIYPATPNAIPPEYVVHVLASRFGFSGDFDDWQVWTVVVDEAHNMPAINVMQPVSHGVPATIIH